MSSAVSSNPEFVAVKKKRYLCGINAAGPAHNVSLGGFSFPVTSSETRADGAEIQRTGNVLELSVEDLKKIQISVENRIVRWTNKVEQTPDGRGGLVPVIKRIRASIYDKRSSWYRPEETDEPLANYIYIQDAPEEAKAVPNSLKTRLAQEIEAASKTEIAMLSDPKDAKIREEHGRAKKLGQKLGEE